MRAIIVAGGMGSRVKTISHIPKTLFPIAGKPLLGRQLDLLLEYEFKEIYLSIGYKSDHIEQYISSKPQYKKHVKLIYDLWKAGSGGCLQFVPPPDHDSLVLFGDIALNMDLKKFSDFHRAFNPLASLALQINDHPAESDFVVLNSNNKCTDIFCKPHLKLQTVDIYMIAGVFILSPVVIKTISSNQEIDLVHDMIAPLIKRGEFILGYPTEEYIDDIGTPKRYTRINQEWITKLPTTVKNYVQG